MDSSHLSDYENSERALCPSLLCRPADISRAVETQRVFSLGGWMDDEWIERWEDRPTWGSRKVNFKMKCYSYKVSVHDNDNKITLIWKVSSGPWRYGQVRECVQ